MPNADANARRSPIDDGFSLARPMCEEHAEVLTDDALRFVADLVRRFRGTRAELLKLRMIRQREIDAGTFPDFLRETATIRSSEWTVAPVPGEFTQPKVQIVPASHFTELEKRLRSPGGIVVADFEDSSAPTWFNCIEGQVNLREAVGGRNLNATLAMRPRGWHLDERHIRIDDEPAPAALVDFGLFFYHNAERLARSGSGPYFYLPKIESHLEARLWNDVFLRAQEVAGIPAGTVRAVVLIETILAAFEMDEILHELRAHSAGLDCGRWDYVFSIIKRFRNHASFVLPDRSQLTTSRHMLGSYLDLIAQTCDRRGVSARCTVSANLEPGATTITAGDLLKIPAGTITEAGLRTNINVCMTYLESWLRGNGHVAVYGAIEDTATAEVSRAQVWQWIRHGAGLADGRKVTRALVHETTQEELIAMERSMGSDRFSEGRFDLATKLFAEVTDADDFPEFMTLLAYGYLN